MRQPGQSCPGYLFMPSLDMLSFDMSPFSIESSDILSLHSKSLPVPSLDMLSFSISLANAAGAIGTMPSREKSRHRYALFHKISRHC